LLTDKGSKFQFSRHKEYLYTRNAEQKNWIFITMDKILKVFVHLRESQAKIDYLVIRDVLGEHLEKICFRASQKILLKDLNITKLCNDFLISENASFTGPYRFLPGHFACDVVGKHIFPLLWRYKPFQVLNSIASVLHPLAVFNRNNTYVYADNDDIFYLRISELSEEENSGKKNLFLILEVFGIDSPRKYLMQEFISMISSRIASLTLNLLSSLLSRNLSLKLTPQDIDFILPQESIPNKILILNIPEPIDPNHIFLFFKQHLLLFLIPFNSPDICSFIRNYQKLKYGQSTKNDYIFIYNSIQSRPLNTSEFNCGQGIVVISMSLYKNDTVLQYFPSGTKNLLSPDLPNITQDPNFPHHSVLLEIWYQGNILEDVLHKKIYSSFLNCTMDIYIETLSSPNFSLWDKAYEHSSPTVLRLQSDLVVYKWLASDLINTFKSSLTNMDKNLDVFCDLEDLPENRNEGSETSEFTMTANFNQCVNYEEVCLLCPVSETIKSGPEKTTTVSYTRKPWVFIRFEKTGITLYAYNWKESVIHNFILFAKDFFLWTKERLYVLKHILMAKMGIYYVGSGVTQLEPHVMNFCRPQEYSEWNDFSLEIMKKMVVQTETSCLDPVKMHGIPLLKTFAIEAKKEAYEESLRKINSKWDQNDKIGISENEIHMFQRTFRLVHFVRT
jgi:hypothetical protein